MWIALLGTLLHLEGIGRLRNGAANRRGRPADSNEETDPSVDVGRILMTNRIRRLRATRRPYSSVVSVSPHQT